MFNSIGNDETGGVNSQIQNRAGPITQCYEFDFTSLFFDHWDLMIFRVSAAVRRTLSSSSFKASTRAGTAGSAFSPMAPRVQAARSRTSASSSFKASISAGTAGWPILRRVPAAANRTLASSAFKASIKRSISSAASSCVESMSEANQSGIATSNSTANHMIVLPTGREDVRRVYGDGASPPDLAIVLCQCSRSNGPLYQKVFGPRQVDGRFRWPLKDPISWQEGGP